jgi:hypothetical protein
MPHEVKNTAWLKSLAKIRHAVADDRVWAELLGMPDSELPSCGIHLAVFVEPFLGYVLDGTKTVESRFSTTRCAPFGRVSPGDVVLLKKTGGGVVGVTQVQTVWSYSLDEASWGEIRKKFTNALRIQDPQFWEQRRGAAYATLMSIGQVRAFEPVAWVKRDRRGWVVLQSAAKSRASR